MKEPPKETPTSLRPNNLYLLERIIETGPGARSMDFGCGSGALVAAARAKGLEAYGAETFYEGLRVEDVELARSWGLDQNVIREIKGGHIDFPDNYFDLVVHNQVFEHVENLDQAANEIQRILKPGGRMIGIFPTRGVLREPHLGLPCVHWFSPGPIRSWWAKFTRGLGFGFDFWGEGDAWFKPAFAFLDERVFYRSRVQIASILKPLFDVKYIEPEWLGFRVPKYKWMLSLPGAYAAARAFSRVMAGPVVEARSKKTVAVKSGEAVEALSAKGR
jgi:SAM-dependent methyltransferase